LPLIEEIGILWQTDTITPAHEHFISHLIKQKLLINIATLQIQEPRYNDKIFVLFLPEHEIHDLGLMYINYEILLQGYQTIFLGESLPIENLLALKHSFENITFVSYFTVEPNPNEVNSYIKEIKEKVLNDDSKMWVTGRLTAQIESKILDSKVQVFSNISELVNQL
jgi:methanogenic corrinoid protein MtbC1